MKKQYRIKKESEFQRVFQEGKSKANRQLVAYFLPQKNQTHWRVGLSVGKRIGNAVTRNQVKRHLRRGVHELSEHISNDMDFILIARPDIINKDFFEIKHSIRHVMSIAGVINEEAFEDSGGNNDL